jgi:hypothetical protein
MESSDQKDTSGQLKFVKAGDQNAGLVTVLHIVMVLMIVLLIVGYIVGKA